MLEERPELVVLSERGPPRRLLVGILVIVLLVVTVGGSVGTGVDGVGIVLVVIIAVTLFECHGRWSWSGDNGRLGRSQSVELEIDGWLLQQRV